jgi:site-specific recombinase XerD
MTTTIAPFEDIANWERALYAFLAEKERRSGSRRTVEGYSRMLQHFFGTLGKPPDQVTSQEVFVFAHGVGPSGKEPSAVTIGARMACISSFYRFLIRMGIVCVNPCDQLERPRVSPSPPRGLTAEEIKRLLAVIPEKPVALRDRAIILALTLTGRRRSEVMNMKAGDISQTGGLFYTYRGKGGKQAKRELPRPAFEAIERALAAWAKSLATMDPNESLWPTDDPDRSAAGLGVTSGTFYGNLQRYFRKAGLPPAGIHILRHSAAKLRRDVGESVEDVSRFLDHSSLAVTTVYLRRLEGQEDSGWREVAALLGV